ncbi:MAG: SH3 domain-containing protein [Treponema sp.]|jgi:hypothetical protein|nr:SH3 domain-containing protein [Treponema sp.]
MGGRFWGVLPAALIIVLCSSCTRALGWGMLLWSIEEPAIPPGTILPVYIRSNIDQVWVVGIPEQYRSKGGIDKFEVPLAQLELVGGKKAAQERAAAFSEYALIYAETLQDGLPIRESTDNSSRRVYRLKRGQIIKILARVEGTPAISATGEPLPGDWYLTLTEDGVSGYCFSYRLRLFEHAGGILALNTGTEEAEQEDTDLERVLSLTWSPESYGTMVSSGWIDTEELANHWRCLPGRDDGIARIYLPNLDRTFSYTRIRAVGNRAWQFEGTPLRMSLRSDTTLQVQYTEGSGASRSMMFTALAADVDDIIIQETERRNALFQAIYNQGPVFSSANYGTLSFSPEGTFTWTDYNLLTPQIIPARVMGGGSIDMGLFIAPSIAGPYQGAFSLTFNGIGGPGVTVDFLYTLGQESADDQGFRIEYVPPENINAVTITRRAASPTIIYFHRTEW